MKIGLWSLPMMLILAMIACSGDSGTMTAYNDDGGIGGTGVSSDGGIGGTGVSAGPIEDFGSLWVNGVRFETRDSTVIIEGGRPITVPDTEALRRHFRRGMIVQVHGTVNPDGKTGVAERVFYGDTLQGEILEIDTAARRMTVLDRKVEVDAATVIGEANFPRLTLESFRIGNIVEVSGFATSDGTIRATWIGLLSADASDRAFDVETDGVVAQHDALSKTFLLGDLQVQYGNLSEGRLPTDLADGQRVEVRGRADPLQKTVDATYVAVIEEEAPLDVGASFWLDGVVTQVSDPSRFKINGRPIMVDDDTQFEQGTAADLAPNVRVVVEGRVNAKGMLVARKVVFHDPKPLEVLLSQSVLLEHREGEDVQVQIIADRAPSALYHAEGLPPGLVLDSETGLISGVLSCESAGDYEVRVSLDGVSSAPTTWVWAVEEACVTEPLSLTDRPPVLLLAEDRISPEGEDILLEIEAVGSDGETLTFEAEGLPPGLILDAVTGVISGTPTCDAAGLYAITLRATDGVFTDELLFNWTVEEAC